MSIVDKFDELAERYSSTDYADAGAYFRRRAELVVGCGRRLRDGATVLDFACGDGGFGLAALAAGLDYHGVDGSPRMVEVARRQLGERVGVGSFDYDPPSPVDATTIFRSMRYVEDRERFLRRVREFTQVKLVFDFNPRVYPTSDVIRDLQAAGWTHAEWRPFLMPQRTSLPRSLQSLLWRLAPLPGARLLTKVWFPLLVSAYLSA
jgi:ubiquinone/menaquinone biosynthesis C-methylase UbiE